MNYLKVEKTLSSQLKPGQTTRASKPPSPSGSYIVGMAKKPYESRPASSMSMKSKHGSPARPSPKNTSVLDTVRNYYINSTTRNKPPMLKTSFTTKNLNVSKSFYDGFLKQEPVTEAVPSKLKLPTTIPLL